MKYENSYIHIKPLLLRRNKNSTNDFKEKDIVMAISVPFSRTLRTNIEDPSQSGYEYILGHQEDSPYTDLE
jgi:hypothetical protein